MTTDIETQYEWKDPAPIAADSGWHALHEHPLIAALLFRKGYRSASEAADFLAPGQGELPDPFRIPNMAAAADRVAHAIGNGEKIGIFGDYDVDGVTSTVLLTLALRVTLPESQVLSILPEREDGYGLSDKAVDSFVAAGVSLIIAVDCGSGDHDHARQIADAGIDLVVLDHHHMDDPGPATAIVVSAQLESSTAFHDLTAAGVAWLFVRALAATGSRVTTTGDPDAGEYLDLVALGTVADVAPLTNYNRTIVHRGLELIRRQHRPGLSALMAVAGQDATGATARTISHALAPRLNAAGRIHTPRLAMDLLMAPSRSDAMPLASTLEAVNGKRRERSAHILAEAYAELRRHPGWNDRLVVSASSPSWEAGIVGAVASRMSEELRRPVLLFRESDGVLSGSARSIDRFDLMASLGEARALLERFGGHSLAAGLTIRQANLEELESRLAASIQRQGLEIPAPRVLRIDARLPHNLATIETVRALSLLEPFGRGNEEPVLLIRNAALRQYSVMGSERQHLKIVTHIDGRRLEAIAWREASRSRELLRKRSIDLAGRLEINSWNGTERIQFILEDFRAS